MEEYSFLNKIGEGSTGVIYRAEKDDHLFAIK